MDEMIEPICKTITVGGQQITIGEVTVRQMPAMSRAAKLILTALENDGKNIFLHMFAVGEVLPDLAPFLAMITGQSEDWFLSLPMSDASALIRAVIEVNASFFIKKTMPNAMGIVRAFASWKE